ncbi:hypothetical protein, partial [Idiomarina sp. UBA1919]|uniref:hypothetical protein n=1 Tax=Idiomarina sp. UBA1919 TaxID=1946640 RepID=UPI00257EDB0B
ILDHRSSFCNSRFVVDSVLYKNSTKRSNRKNQEVEKKKASFSGAGLRVCDLTNTPNTSEIVERF